MNKFLQLACLVACTLLISTSAPARAQQKSRTENDNSQKPRAQENTAIKELILKVFPQADRNRDGIISDAEEAAASRRALERFPQADRDKDGLFSDAEKRAFLDAASRRSRRNQSNDSSKRKTRQPARKPSFANVKYGQHERQVFDIWLAKPGKPAPLAIYIHGGGFKGGSKENLNAADLNRLLEAGISVAAINYRYVTTHPLPTSHHDARRALQHMRSRAGEWNIDKDKVAAFGGSAGAQICMWLAFSDEMARPESSDPIERESTRLTCVATAGGQTSNGAEFWKKTVGPLLENRNIESLVQPFKGERDPEKIRMMMWNGKTLQEANQTASQHSAIHLVTSDDPPIFMSYGMSPTASLPKDPKRIRGWLIHHVNLGIVLKEKMDALKLESHLKFPGSKTKYDSLVDFLSDKLLK